MSSQAASSIGATLPAQHAARHAAPPSTGLTGSFLRRSSSALACKGGSGMQLDVQPCGGCWVLVALPPRPTCNQAPLGALKALPQDPPPPCAAPPPSPPPSAPRAGPAAAAARAGPPLRGGGRQLGRQLECMAGCRAAAPQIATQLTNKRQGWERSWAGVRPNWSTLCRCSTAGISA